MIRGRKMHTGSIKFGHEIGTNPHNPPKQEANKIKQRTQLFNGIQCKNSWNSDSEHIEIEYLRKL